MIVERMALYIKSRGIDKRELCKKTGLSMKCIESVMEGKKKLDIEEYLKICTALGISFEYFFNGNNKK